MKEGQVRPTSTGARAVTEARMRVIRAATRVAKATKRAPYHPNRNAALASADDFLPAMRELVSAVENLEKVSK